MPTAVDTSKSLPYKYNRRRTGAVGDDRRPLARRAEQRGSEVSYLPASRTKAADLIDRLMAIDTPSEITLRRLERDAEAVMDVDPAGAHCVLGGVASLRWDAASVREHFRIALQHANHFVTYHNYSIALALVDEWRESFEAADEAVKMAPDNTVVLDHAMEAAVAVGQLRVAQACCERLNALRPAEDPHAATGLLEALVTALDRGIFEEANVRRVLEIASSLQRAEGVHGARTPAKLDQDEPHSFLFRRFVNASPERAAALNAELADQVVSQDGLLEDPGLRFVPLFVGVDD